MSLLLGLFGNLTTTLTIIIAMLLVIGIIYVLIKIPALRPIALLIFLVVFVFCGFTACYHNIVYLSTNNLTIGDVVNSYIKTTQTTTTVEKDKPEWLIENLGFRLVEDNTYTSTLILEPFDKLDFAKNNYCLFVNNEKCLINEVENQAIRAQYPYTFYNSDNKAILTDTLYINFAFHANETKLVLKTNGGQSAVNLWRAYQAKNNFLLSVKSSDVENTYFNTINKVDGEYAIYNFKNGTLYGYTVDINTTYTDTLTLPNQIADMQLKSIEANAFKGLTLTEITFDGTSEAFLNITRYSNWHKTIDDKYIEKVKCSDVILLFSSKGTYLSTDDNTVTDEEKNNILVCKYKDNTQQEIVVNSIKLTANDIPNINNLIEIQIPDSIYELDNKLFYEAKNLDTVYIGKNLTVVNNWVFDCKNFVVDAENENFRSLDGNLYNKELTVMYRYATKKNLSNFNLPDTVKELNDYCFSSALNLTSINITNPFEKLGVGSFRYCTKLTSINMLDNITVVPDSCFYGCVALKEITLPKVVTIESHAFQYCRALEKITVSGYLKNLGSYLFSYCDKDITVVYTSLKWNFENYVVKSEKWYDHTGIQTVTVICDDGTLTYKNTW